MPRDQPEDIALRALTSKSSDGTLSTRTGYTTLFEDEDSSFVYHPGFDLASPRNAGTTTFETFTSPPDLRAAQYAPLGPVESRRQRLFFRGWRRSVAAATCVASLVLLINLAFAIMGATSPNTKAGVGLIYEGDCNAVSRWNTVLHLCINLLGVLLLCASNYTMQCLNAPTRRELNKAHSQRISLEIGISSFKNLKHLDTWKVVLWALLCLSTLPLHLFWNSTVFATDATYLFDIALVTRDFLTESSFGLPNGTCDRQSHEDMISIASRIQTGVQDGNYTSLTSSECFRKYSTDLLFDRRNLILVTTPHVGMNTIECYEEGVTSTQLPWNGSSVVSLQANEYPDYWWYSSDPSTNTKDIIEQAIAQNENWRWGEHEIEECYSETRDIARCQLQFAMPLIWTVVACNAIKVVCLALTVYYLWDVDEPILATTGDAIASFLEDQDHSTQGHCLMDNVSLAQGEWQSTQRSKHGRIYDRKPKKRLYSATSAWRFWISMILCCAYLTVGIVLVYLIWADQRTLLDHFGTGYGGEVLLTFDDSLKGTVSGAMLVNSFQLALSTTYFVYNSLYTAQCGATEWSQFSSSQPSTLRVTYPRGQQRSTFYLQLPWRYGIPLTSLLALMHFLISQSIFFVRLEYYDSQGTRKPTLDLHGVSYSGSATLTSVCVGAFMIILQFINAARKLDNRMPIHGNRSAVISAMCHLISDEGNKSDEIGSQMDLKPLMWGVTRQPKRARDSTTDILTTQTEDGADSEVEIEPGHCSFTDQIVSLPEVGQPYI